MFNLNDIYVQSKQPIKHKHHKEEIIDLMKPESNDSLKNPVNAILFVLIASIQTFAIFEIFA